MTPLYTLFLCLPAALALIACAGGLAALWPSPARSPEHLTWGKPRGRSSAPGDSTHA